MLAQVRKFNSSMSALAHLTNRLDFQIGIKQPLMFKCIIDH